MSHITAAKVAIKEPHWKVGDNMGSGPTDPNGFGIGQIAVVDRGGGCYDVRFYDRKGRDRGGLDLRLR